MRWSTPCLSGVELLDHLGGPRTAHERLGITLDTAYRWSVRGRSLTLWEADHYATQAGVHPAEVWEHWYELADKVLT